MKVIYNLYYRFYRLLVSIGEDDTPRYNAVLLLSITSIFNFITAAMVLSIALNKIIIVNLPKFFLFLVGLLIVAVHSYMIFRNKKYLQIEQSYEGESKGQKWCKKLAAGLYVIITITSFVVYLIYLKDHPITDRAITDGIPGSR